MTFSRPNSGSGVNSGSSGPAEPLTTTDEPGRTTTYACDTYGNPT